MVTFIYLFTVAGDGKVVAVPRLISNDNLWLNSKFHSCVESLQNPFKSVTNTNYNSHMDSGHVGC